jgi:hypothetical protein
LAILSLSLSLTRQRRFPGQAGPLLSLAAEEEEEEEGGRRVEGGAVSLSLVTTICPERRCDVFDYCILSVSYVCV